MRGRITTTQGTITFGEHHVFSEDEESRLLREAFNARSKDAAAADREKVADGNRVANEDEASQDETATDMMEFPTPSGSVFVILSAAEAEPEPSSAPARRPETPGVVTHGVRRFVSSLGRFRWVSVDSVVSATAITSTRSPYKDFYWASQTRPYLGTDLDEEPQSAEV